jgi:short-subunit dehydrogenase
MAPRRRIVSMASAWIRPFRSSSWPFVLSALAGAAALTWLVSRRHAGALTNKLVVVTGGSRGLGLLLAREFAEAGARVVIMARDADELDSAAADLTACGLEVATHVCDVTDRDAVRQAVFDIHSVHGPIDVLVNNAGVLHVGPSPSMTHEDLRTSMETNFWGTVNMVDAVMPGMVDRKEGRIVNICSVGGVSPVPFMLPYSASKAALNGYSLNLGYDLAPHGVSVTVVHPFVMRTGGPINGVYRGASRRGLYAAMSLADENALLSVSPRRVARKVVRATVRGDSIVFIGWRTRIVAVLQGVMPRALAAVYRTVARALPQSTTQNGESGRRMARQLEAGWQKVAEKSRAKNNQPQTL